MAPKKKVEAPTPEVVDVGPEEEEEEGPEKATFLLTAVSVQDLPCELQTIVCFSGPFKERRSLPAEASKAPSGWDLQKNKVIRKQAQDLFNDLVSKPLSITLRDAGADSVVIGRTEISLLPLLHDSTEVTAELELKLTPEYHAKWFPEEVKESDPKDKKAKDKKAPEPAKVVPEVKVEQPPVEVRPTKIVVSVTVNDLVGPVEDRDCWTTLTINTKGIFSLPETLTSAGMASPEDTEGHPMIYHASMLGESLGIGSLAPPIEADKSQDDDEDEVQWRERSERCKAFVRFKDSSLLRYRGKQFINEFRQMLNETGGVWFHFHAEEKPSTDPKKPNPPEWAELARQCTTQAWLDLRSFIKPGVCATESCCQLEKHLILDQASGEALLPGSKTYVRLSLELSYDVTPPEPKENQVHPKKLIPKREDVKAFPNSMDSVILYREAIERGFETICRDCSHGDFKGGVPDVVSQLKEVGSYEELKRDLRAAMVGIFRERLRKDTRAVPGKSLEGTVKDEFVSGTFTYLQWTVSDVLNELRQKAAGKGPEQDGGQGSPSHDTSVEVPAFAQVLAESQAVRKAREALGAATEASSRCARLAYEAELVGNWDRAAALLQNRFLIKDLKLQNDPQEWVSFAKFCGRSRGRQASAEEALRQAVRLLAEGVQVSEDVAMEVDIFLACLLLDRGRHEEAEAVFRSWHEKDFANGTFRFLLGLTLFLRCDFTAAKPYLESVAKSRDWFKGLPDHRAVVDKLRAFRGSDGPLDVEPYAEILAKLLSFGLSSLVFTFLDQTNTLPKDSMNKEALVIIDAKASALDRDYTAAIQRLEPLLTSGQASQEAWRLAGECYVQLQEFDKAMQAIQQAMALGQKFEDPGIYIRLGSVLLVKKRWKQARDAFLRSIQLTPTAEAWSGVAYAEYRSDELQFCYEAACEANLLDNQRADIWMQLCLVQLRLGALDAADRSCRQCLLQSKSDCEELLLEAANEYCRRERELSLAEACARRALEQRDSGQGHAVLSDILAHLGEAETSVLEAQIALKMLPDQPELRKALFTKALKLCEELGDGPLTASLHAVQKLADDQFAALEKA